MEGHLSVGDSDNADTVAQNPSQEVSSGPRAVGEAGVQLILFGADKQGSMENTLKPDPDSAVEPSLTS